MATSVFTDWGRSHVTAALAAETWYVAMGTGAGTPDVSDTTLFTESSEDRVVGVASQQTTDTANDTFQVTGTIVADGTKTITNAGVFDAADAGNMIIKGDFDADPSMVSGDSLALTCQANF